MYGQILNFKGILTSIHFLSNLRYSRFCIYNRFPWEFLDFIRLPKLSRAQRNHCTMLYVNETDRAGNGVNMSVHMHVCMSACV